MASRGLAPQRRQPQFRRRVRITLVDDGMRSSVLLFLGFALFGQPASREYFVPTHRAAGIGAARDEMPEETLEARTALMIQTQTFAILREPEAVAGARRVTADSKLQPLFRSAAKRSGFPQATLEAVAYLESWGDPKAESPSGPKGIMQVSEATAREMGLKVTRATRYRVTRQRVQVRSKSKTPKYKTVTRKEPYTVTVRDDRLNPARAIPAAAVYLAGMERKFGGRDWAVFAYHCGQGCVAHLLDLTRAARGIPKDQATVARMFFSASPVWNREIYETVQREMQRDWSPTYWFRAMRAQQLLALYRRDPREFASLAQQYKSEFNPGRAPHRLTVWLTRSDLVFHTGDDIRSVLGAKLLVKAFDRPEYFGYSLNIPPSSPLDLEDREKGAPVAIGALVYVAFETRRLFDQLNQGRDRFRPLEVVSLVEPEDYARQLSEREALSHVSGQVFDIDASDLPPSEMECLRFVLDDLGWAGYLGFVDEGANTLHVGSAPAARDFFTSVFEEAAGARPAD